MQISVKCESFDKFFGRWYINVLFLGGRFVPPFGAVAQFGRALAWHARGQGFDPPRLHQVYCNSFAEVAELVYALVSKTSSFTAVRVRFPSSAFFTS